MASSAVAPVAATVPTVDGLGDDKEDTGLRLCEDAPPAGAPPVHPSPATGPVLQCHWDANNADTVALCYKSGVLRCVCSTHAAIRCVLLPNLCD